MTTFTLTSEEYEALVFLARSALTATSCDGAVVARQETHAEHVRLEQFLAGIERKNGVTRDTVVAQWTELGATPPPGTEFPHAWPPSQQLTLTYLHRKVCRADVEAAVAKKATKPSDILVTKDPGGLNGWTSLDEFFGTSS